MKRSRILLFVLPALLAVFSFAAPPVSAASFPLPAPESMVKKSITPGELEWKDGNSGPRLRVAQETLPALTAADWQELRPACAMGQATPEPTVCFAADHYLDHNYPKHGFW